MENEFECVALAREICFECLFNLREDVHYKGWRPIAVIVARNDLLDGN